MAVQRNYRMALPLKLVGPVFCILMNNYKYGSYETNMYGFFPRSASSSENEVEPYST